MSVAGVIVVRCVALFVAGLEEMERRQVANNADSDSRPDGHIVDNRYHIALYFGSFDNFGNAHGTAADTAAERIPVPVAKPSHSKKQFFW